MDETSKSIDWIVDGIIIERASFPSISLSFFFFCNFFFINEEDIVIISNMNLLNILELLTRTSNIYTSDDDVCSKSFFIFLDFN